ncbi:hypothetical protein [Pyrodictium abyssi]|uniref:DOD-type homing endonuclease domain-containing protein n=1 Tax=Pyrodictium abyssi TaxID=54256 RepID=A0ABM8IWS2_9CREN|nr:hypothetical protein PABY_15560 [Pyrodictium abyssi]
MKELVYVIASLGFNANVFMQGGEVVVSVCGKCLVFSLTRFISRVLEEGVEGVPLEALIGVVEGLIDSDGNIERRRGGYFRVAITTASKKIASLVVSVCSLIGASCNYYLHGGKYRVFIFNRLDLLGGSYKVASEMARRARSSTR